MPTRLTPESDNMTIRAAGFTTKNCALEKALNDIEREPVLSLKTVFTRLCLVVPIAFASALAQDSPASDFSAIDKHALEAPAEAEKSFESLAQYLVSPATTDLQKARVIFRWIAQNISYDTESFFSGDFSAFSAQNALQERKAVCDGYAGLFERLAKLADLEVVKISGYAKGYGFIAGGRTEKRPNHAWNAIKIDGKWRLIDCTWGAGYVDDQKHFKRELQNHYFLTLPDEFIYDHFPVEEKWQLMAHPFSREQYDGFVYLRPGFFQAGLKLKSHTNATIRSAGTTTITLDAPSDALILATLTQGDKKLDDSFTFSQRTSSDLEVRCSFPRPGVYILRLFAKRMHASGTYEWALDYSVDAKEGSDQRYPKVFSFFIDKGCSLITPMSGVLSGNSQQEFRIKVPGAEKVALIQSGKWTYLTSSGSEFSGTVPIEKGDLPLLAKFPGSELFQTLISFTVR